MLKRAEQWPATDVWRGLASRVDRGGVGIRRPEGDRWVQLVAWTPSAAERPGGAESQLATRAPSRRLTLLVNGAEAAGVEGAALRGEAAGVFAGGDLNQAAVERLAVPRPD